ncbi:CHAT domain-containing protein [Coleofasciculus sp. H7-2]|uniref:CHAT domain-containing protein n=1 Tax=Coleofasciculus sp. H7-2 TaxID=3351545 RepID=UPI0036722819
MGLFLSSFLCIQGLTWLLGAKSLPVVAQTPAKVTNPHVTAPEALVQEAKKLYRQEQFPEALTRLQQAEGAFVASKETLKQAMTLNLQGQVYLALGQPEAAAERFSAAATTYERGRDKTGAIKSRINQAQALRKAGFYRRAWETLEQLNANLNQTDPQLKAIALRSLGITQRLIGDLDDAQKAIEESLEIAESLPSPAREENESAAYLMLGNIAKDRRNTSKEQVNNSVALKYFEEAIAYYEKAAETATTPTERIEAQLNQLSVFGDAGQPFTDPERELLHQVQQTLDQLPLSRTTVHARINWARMVMQPNSQANVSPQDIAQQLAIAVEQARKLKDLRSESYALGQLGELRQKLGQLEQAQENTQQALAIAQSIGASDISYRWQWQLGQILREQGKTAGQLGETLTEQEKTAEAIASYKVAVNNLQDLRGDLVNLNPDAQFSFRKSVEPVYREYAGMLLQSKNPEDLKNARTAIESLQQAELVNFFRENCITSIPKSVDEILAETDQKAALIYPIVLPESLEVVVTLPGNQLRHITISKPRVEVQGTFTRLRSAIAPESVKPTRTAPNENEPLPATPQEAQPKGNEPNAVIPGDDTRSAEPTLIPTDGGYLVLAQEVYGWLIRPFEEDLKASGVETLVFVLDAPLLNLPMAVLHDGEKFLVEKYAIAQTPGLKLLDTKPLARGEITALKAGLSEARLRSLGSPPQSVYFPPLLNVQQELEGIQLKIPGKLILNEEFTTAAIQRAINSVSYPIVHLATHGKFSSNAEETFILTSDDRLNINQLNQLLRGREEDSRKAIELLVLSACETAVGDERAALGLAGVAVKAGARSTLATLWQVDDESTAKSMIRFYQELKDTKVSKAEALRRAQLWLMQQDSKYKSPYYWAPFILVGNWL